MALAKKPKLNPQGAMAGRSQMVKQPIVSRKIVYGRQKVSGAIVFMSTTGKSEFLYMIVAIASNELNSIEKIFFNDDELTIDGIWQRHSPITICWQSASADRIGC